MPRLLGPASSSRARRTPESRRHARSAPRPSSIRSRRARRSLGADGPACGHQGRRNRATRRRRGVAVARARFPEDRKGQITRQLATKVSDSSVAPAARLDRDGRAQQRLLARALQQLQDHVPVSGRQLRRGRRRRWRRYFANGYRTVILDVPRGARGSRAHVRRVRAGDAAGVMMARCCRTSSPPGGRAARSRGRRPRRHAVTYGAARRRSNQIARLLAGGLRRGDRVALLMREVADGHRSLLAIYKADAIYVPLDPACPVPRLGKMLESCESAWLLAADVDDRTSNAGPRG